MPKHDEIMPRNVEREWIGLYAMAAVIGNSIAAMYFGWWLIVPLIDLGIWQAVRVYRVTNESINAGPDDRTR